MAGMAKLGGCAMVPNDTATRNQFARIASDPGFDRVIPYLTSLASACFFQWLVNPDEAATLRGQAIAYTSLIETLRECVDDQRRSVFPSPSSPGVPGLGIPGCAESATRRTFPPVWANQGDQS